MSSQDPVWMTPLVKSMLRVKSRISNGNEDRLKAINKRISTVINQNEFLENIGTREWLRTVDSILQRHRMGVTSLDHNSHCKLNNYFGKLCTDETYVEPELLEIGDDTEIPTITKQQAWNCLRSIKRTATGPDSIPYAVWKDHAELLTPLLTNVWNLSLETHTWPRTWKRSNIDPLPKVEVPNENNDYRGINITSIIARAFEKTVLSVHAKKNFEQH